jgi:hypothetical protein
MERTAWRKRKDGIIAFVKMMRGVGEENRKIVQTYKKREGQGPSRRRILDKTGTICYHELLYRPVEGTLCPLGLREAYHTLREKARGQWRKSFNSSVRIL